MNALIITPFFEHLPEKDMLSLNNYSLVICADSAVEIAERLEVRPNLVIGDFDHGGVIPSGENVYTVPCEKDDTDTMLCLKYAMAQGAAEVTILGGIGGRLDHTVANLQALAYAAKRNCRAILTDGINQAMIVTKSTRVSQKKGYYLSIFAFGGDAKGVTVSGVKYPLSGALLTPEFPLGISNEIISDFAEISLKEGRLLLIESRKESSDS